MNTEISTWVNDNKDSISKLIPLSYTSRESIPAKEYIKSLIGWTADLNSMWSFLEQQKIVVIKENFLKRA